MAIGDEARVVSQEMFAGSSLGLANAETCELLSGLRIPVVGI